MKIIKLLTIFILTSMFLQGCGFMVGAATGAAAIAVIYDHRTLTNVFNDTKMANEIHAKFRLFPGLRTDSHIEVTVFNRIVLLTGETPSLQLKQQAEALAKSVPNVKRVYNQISIEGPTSTLTRTSDSWITAKIKAQMLAAENLRSGSIKVLTENGVVYLMGNVTRKQADIAVNIARQVTGVQKVIKIFQYK